MTADSHPARQEQVQQLKDEYVECRALGHADTAELGYGVTDEAGVLQASWGWLRRVCGRCGRVREDFYDPYKLPLGSPRTSYPDGYLLRGVGVGAWRQEARAELWRRRASPPPTS